MYLPKLLGLFRFLTVIGLFLPGCGDVHLGAAAPSTDPAPTTGTIIAQAAFLGGTQVTGNATIYDMGSGQYIIRIDPFSAPTESGLQLIPVTNSVHQAAIAITSYSGAKNYTYPVGGTVTWNQVIVHSTIKNIDYATASF